MTTRAECDLLARIARVWCDRVIRRDQAWNVHQNASQLLGVNVTASTYEKGAAFIGGVLQRAGSDALGALWSREGNLPTPAELDAPGLWLARLALD